MSSEQVAVVLAGAVALAVVLAVLALVAVGAAHRRGRELSDALDRAEARASELADRLARLERRTGGTTSGATGGTSSEAAGGAVPARVHEGRVIEGPDDGPVEARVVAERIDGRLFTDIVARETAVRAASWSHGVRRALAPEVRNRIRFEMRRELKRARKQRRADLKAALRDLQARERRAMREERDEGDAA